MPRTDSDVAPVRVLILGGWSPGPLDYIQERFSATCTFVEPALHMPPHGVRWCCTWEAALLAVVAWASWYSLSHFAAWSVLFLAALPPLVVLLVRGSIRRSVAAANAAIAEHAIEVVVGFSWGGGIGCWLLRDGTWTGPTLLLAPTINAMASAARLTPVATPFFRVHRHSANSPQRALCLERSPLRGGAGDDDDEPAADADGASRAVQVFHATYDGFCPASQVHALRSTGAVVHVCRDGHTLDSEQTLDEVGESFVGLLEQALSRRASGG
jgi:hypothetical protein